MTDLKKNPQVEEFTKLLSDRESLAERSENASDLIKDLLQQGLDSADRRLEELAQIPEVKEYFLALGGPALRAAQELQELEPTLMQLGLGEQIDAKRREIEEMLPADAMAAVRYFMQLSGVEVTHTATEVLPAEPVAAAEEGESERTRLVITVDPNNNIAINGKVLPTGRDLQVAGKVGNEAIIRKTRVEVIKLLSEQSGRDFRASEIWKAVRPGEEFESSHWNWYYKDFFADELTVGKSPVVKVKKIHPRLNHYAIEEFDITFEETEEAFEISDATVFTLPHGREVGGKTGQVLNLLRKASAENPVVEDTLLRAGVYSMAEIQAMRNPRALLSGIISQARQELQGTDLQIIRVNTSRKDPISNRSYPGYYIVEKAPGSEDGPDHGEPEVPQAGATPEAESGPDEPLSIYEATVLALFLNLYKEKLVARDIVPLPKEVYEKLNELVAQINGEKTNQALQMLRIRSLEKAINLLTDVEKFEEATAVFAEAQDARMLLLEYLLDRSDEEIQFIKDLINANTGQVWVVNAGRRKGFEIVKVESRAVTEDGTHL